MKTLFLFFMDLGRLLCAPLLFVFRVRRMHLDGSPAHTLPKGGAVLVCNHVGFSDPMVLGCAVFCCGMPAVSGLTATHAILRRFVPAFKCCKQVNYCVFFRKDICSIAAHSIKSSKAPP